MRRIFVPIGSLLLSLETTTSKTASDFSQMDVNKELAFSLGDRESATVGRHRPGIVEESREGTYGKCARCGRDIDERRLEALPTARYDANCQAIIEQAKGVDTHSL